MAATATIRWTGFSHRLLGEALGRDEIDVVAAALEEPVQADIVSTARHRIRNTRFAMR